MRDYARAGTNAYICLYVHACTCMNEYVYAYMNVRMMRAYGRAGAHALVCQSVCLYVCLYVYMYVYMSVCVILYVHACACVRASVFMYIRMSVTFFLTSDLLHLESNIYVGLFAYMRTHARQHLKLEVRHKNSHRRIHTHTY